jgi:hypothetical protein
MVSSSGPFEHRQECSPAQKRKGNITNRHKVPSSESGRPVGRFCFELFNTQPRPFPAFVLHGHQKNMPLPLEKLPTEQPDAIFLLWPRPPF